MNDFNYSVLNNETMERKDYTNEQDALNQFEKLQDMNILTSFYMLENDRVLFKKNSIVETEETE